MRFVGCLAFPAGNDYVLVGRRQALSRPFAAMVEDFKRAGARLI